MVMRWIESLRRSAPWVALLWVGWTSLGPAYAGTPTSTASAVITSRQIEADWLRQEAIRSCPVAAGRTVAPEQDARGGCDGVKSGRWGFHTANEPRPWWQVDLGRLTPIDRVVLYNRCDSTAARNAGS